MSVDVAKSRAAVVSAAPKNDPVATPSTLLELLVELAETPIAELVSGDALVALCADTAGVLCAAGVAVLVVEDAGGALVVGGASDERVAALAAMQATQKEGPAWTALGTGRSVVVADLSKSRTLAPFATRALGAGVYATVAVPLGSTEPRVGVLQAFLTARQPPTAALVEGITITARVLGATLANAHLHRSSARLAVQLSDALANRAPVEQAKGLLAERHRVGTGEAFGLLRAHARRNRITVLHAAEDVLAGSTVQPPDPPPLSAAR